MSALEIAVNRVRGLLLPALVFTVAVLGIAVMVLATRLERANHQAAAAIAAPPARTFPVSTSPAVASAFPDDVAAYLTFLQKIEQDRVALVRRKEALSAPPSPANASEPPPADPAADWLILVRDFHTQPIPEPCNPLAAEYGGLLNTTSSGSDTTALDAVAARADGELAKLAQRYGAPAPFKIGEK
ncbi:hypothetical protein CCAX7_11750 [Capsulimonas corticalis]|uniref:Uncharacterized protein n=2 Tax=Capsulimonas corticalis TaxID=2219043 RepID=A0A402D763_9BACT|nr:hypothetical protein CCAX7_11750 [Capsulimonas corticalis]